MPCSDGTADGRREAEVALYLTEVTGEHVVAEVRLLDVHTAWLCAWCRLNEDQAATWSEPFQAWWKLHEAEDARREAAQQDAERWAWAHTEGK